VAVILTIYYAITSQIHW